MPAGLSKAEVPTYEIRPSQQGQGMSSFGMSSALALAVALSWQYTWVTFSGDAGSALDVQPTLAEARCPLTLGCGGVALSWQTDRQLSVTLAEKCVAATKCVSRSTTDPS